MKRLWPLLLALSGILMIFGGFVYDVLFAGIPYQDPTPELAANYAFHAQMASMIGSFGLGVLLLGIVALIWRGLARRNRVPNA